VRSFVIIGRTATASSEFLLNDLAGTSGRLDVLVRSVRAALLTSHGVRKDAEVFLVLLGGERAPRTVRIRGETAKFLRPDEPNLAVLLQKALASRVDDDATGFVDLRNGVSISRGGIIELLPAFDGRALYVLSEGAPDVRGAALAQNAVIVLGDHTGFDAGTLAALQAHGAASVSLGPVSLHTDDAVCVMNNELDRRAL
jgi:tRNA (pseudouridine54-N1)-methyltransferase